MSYVKPQDYSKQIASLLSEGLDTVTGIWKAKKHKIPKEKLVKKVTGLAPNCPSGYKKK